MQFFDLNYDILSYLMTFLDSRGLCQLRSTCTHLSELATAQLIRHVTLDDSLHKARSFCRFMLKIPTRIPLMRSLAVGPFSSRRMESVFPVLVEDAADLLASLFPVIADVADLLAMVLQQTVNLVSLAFYDTLQWVLGSENVSKALVENCTHITELSLYDINGPSITNSSSTDIREILQQLQGSLRRLRLNISSEIDFAYILEPLQSVLEVLTLHGTRADFPVEHGRQWPRVYELCLSSRSVNTLELLYAFPNLRRLRVDSCRMYRRRDSNMHPSTAGWTNLDSLAGEYDHILSLGLRSRVTQVELRNELAGGVIRFRDAPYLDFLKNAGPRFLSLCIDSRDISRIFFNPQLASSVPGLQYLEVVFNKFGPYGFIIADILPRMHEAIKSSKIVHLFVSIIGCQLYEVPENLTDYWLPLFANSLPSLQYIGFHVDVEDYKPMEPIWFKIGQPDESDLDNDMVDGRHRRRMENIDQDLAQLLKRQCLGFD